MSETSDTVDFTSVSPTTTGTIIIYRDYSQVSEAYDPQHAAGVGATTVGHSNSTFSAQSGQQNFPTKLHYILEEMEKDGMSHIASWQSHGRCFMVHNQEEFVEQILLRWFCQSKFASFRRQLNIYGFQRINSGPDKGGYYHELFLRGKRFLTQHIPRVYIKGVGGAQRRSNANVDTTTNVNFYTMRPLPTTPSSLVSAPSALLDDRTRGNTSTRPSMGSNEEPVVVVHEGSRVNHRQCNIAAAQFRTNFSDRDIPTQYNDNSVSAGNATVHEILLRQLREVSLSSSSPPSLAQTAMAIASHRQQEQSMAAAAAAAPVNNTVDSGRLRMELIREYLSRINGSQHY